MTREYEAYCEMQREYRSFVRHNYIPLNNHLYALNEITSGERYNLIMWCRSNQYRRQNNFGKCPEWCDSKRKQAFGNKQSP